MMNFISPESVVQNLKDAGCDHKIIEDFFRYDGINQAEQLRILQRHRENLLHRVHKEEKRISCLDYLIYQIENNNRHDALSKKEGKK